jgi:large subunit ribosomal protein L10
VADYRGLTVSEMHLVRRSLRANGVSLKIAKNRLLKIAADEAGLAELKPMLDGPTAIASTTGDEVSLARALQDAFRPYKVVTVRGGLLAGQPVGAADLARLATLPSREVLLARLAGGMAAPLTGMAGVLAANLRNLVGVLNAVADQKRQAEPAGADVAAEAPADEAQKTEAEAAADEAPADEAPAVEAEATAADAAAADIAPAGALAADEETPAEQETTPQTEATAEGAPAEEAAGEEAAPTDDAESTQTE